MTERFVWRNRRWSLDLLFVLVPFALVVTTVARRLDGKPLPFAAEVAFWGFALVFSALLLRAHLGVAQVLTVDDEGVRMDRPNALVAKHLWRLRWDEIARAVVFPGEEARSLMFEPARRTRAWSPQGFVLTAKQRGFGASVVDEAGLLAALARRVPVVSTPESFAVTGGREFAFRPLGAILPRWITGLVILAAFILIAFPAYDAWREKGPWRIERSLVLVGMLLFIFGTGRWVRGLRYAVVVGEEGIALVRRSPGHIGKPAVERFAWSVAWSDLRAAEREADTLWLRAEPVDRRVPLGSEPLPGVVDAAGLVAELRARGVAVAERGAPLP